MGQNYKTDDADCGVYTDLADCGVHTDPAESHRPCWWKLLSQAFPACMIHF